MPVYTTSDKPMDDIGVGTAVRLKCKGTLSEVLASPQDSKKTSLPTPEPPIKIVERIVYREPEITWTLWWKYTKQLLMQTWRKCVRRDW